MLPSTAIASKFTKPKSTRTFVSWSRLCEGVSGVSRARRNKIQKRARTLCLDSFYDIIYKTHTSIERIITSTKKHERNHKAHSPTPLSLALLFSSSELKATAQSTSNNKKNTKTRFLSYEPSAGHTPYPTPHLPCCRRHQSCFFLFPFLALCRYGFWVFGIYVRFDQNMNSHNRKFDRNVCLCGPPVSHTFSVVFAAGSSQPIYHSLIISMRSIRVLMKG